MISFYPDLRDRDIVRSVADAVRRGLFPGGHYAGLVEELFQKEMGAERALLTPSCTAALHMALRLVPIRPGDEVILPSYNFPAAANAVLLCGGTPVFCDIDPRTQNISVSDAAARVTKRTRAVVCVHYAAVGCDMDGLSALCRASDLSLIEDAAQAVGAARNGRHLGTLSRFGCYSFHATKVFSSGEGGALVYGEADASRAAVYRDNGTDREAFLQGRCSSYAWQGTGESMRMSELAAAAVYPQLLGRAEIIGKRLSVHAAYDEAFRPAAARERLAPMFVPVGCEPNGHIYYVRLRDEAARVRAGRALGEAGIPALTHYVPLHLSPMGRALGYAPEDLPESKKAHETLLRLPIHEEMTPDQAFFVAEALLKAADA
jgi:dTDP-4-amino-4,6-dideoxygalactose transaminase